MFGCVCNISIIDLEIVKNKKNRLLLFCYKLNQNMLAIMVNTPLAELKQLAMVDIVLLLYRCHMLNADCNCFAL